MGLTFEVEDVPDRTIPEGLPVRAALADMVIRTFEYTDRKDNERKEGSVLQWWFEIVSDGNYTGRKVKLETDPRISNHPRNRFRLVAEALLGRQLNVGENLESDDLLGLPVELTVKHVPDKKDTAKFYEEVDQIIPVDGTFSFNDEPPF